jgi:hypothetical protein
MEKTMNPKDVLANWIRDNRANIDAGYLTERRELGAERILAALDGAGFNLQSRQGSIVAGPVYRGPGGSNAESVAAPSVNIPDLALARPDLAKEAVAFAIEHGDNCNIDDGYAYRSGYPDADWLSDWGAFLADHVISELDARGLVIAERGPQPNKVAPFALPNERN